MAPGTSPVQSDGVSQISKVPAAVKKTTYPQILEVAPQTNIEQIILDQVLSVLQT